MKRVAISGSSGYLGRKLVPHLRECGLQVLGLDNRRPCCGEPDQFAEIDICDPELAKVLGAFKPDTIIHGAFIVEPTRDHAEMRRVNIEGSRNLLCAATGVNPERLMMISSATVYGAWPDNPNPIEEDCPLRARQGFPYSSDKIEVEKMFEEFETQRPEVAVSRVRPSMVGGPGMDNYLSRFLFGMRFLASFDGCDQMLQLIHENDVAAAIYEILSKNGRGAFNAGPPDTILVSEIADRTKRWNIPVPFWFARLVYRIGWALHLPWPKSPPDFLYFARFPWVVRSKRLEEELGFAFHHSSEETLEEILRKGE